MTKVLLIVVFICLIFSILSIMVTPEKDDDKKAVILAAEETDDDDDDEETDDDDDDDDEETDDDDEEPVVSSLSFSTSAALSSDDYIAPDISGGRIPIDCVEGSWEDVPDAVCDQGTGKIQQRKYITPARNGGNCGVNPYADNYIYQDRDCAEYCTLDADWSPAACPTGCLWNRERRDESITQTKGQTPKKYVSGNGSPCYGVDHAKRKQTKQCPETDTCQASYEQRKKEDQERLDALTASYHASREPAAEMSAHMNQGGSSGGGQDGCEGRACF